jgi:RimJ/RimL family protein N-acetyltransferase
MSAWPFFDLKLHLGAVDLAIPTDDVVLQLAELAEEPIVPAGKEEWLPFLANRATDRNERLRRVMQFHWSTRANHSIDSWQLAFGIYFRGRPQGTISLYSEQFTNRRIVRTGSWIVQHAQGAGLGTTARSMLIEMSMRLLEAKYVESRYVETNAASARVSEKLGYEPNGYHIDDRLNPAPIIRNVILTRDRWKDVRPAQLDKLHIEGFDACKPLLVHDGMESS